MKYFVGIVPSEKVSADISKIQQKFGDNRLEPHITLRPPVTPLNIDDWVDTIKTVACGFSPFTVHLSRTAYFGKNVLFISVQSESLEQLHALLIPKLKTFEPTDKEPLRKYHPHLTLGRKWCGFTESDFEAMEKSANEYLNKERIISKVNFLRIYHKPASNQRYEKLIDVPLKGI